MQVNLDESAPIFGDAIEHFATNCMSLHKGTVFVIEKILLQPIDLTGHHFFGEDRSKGYGQPRLSR